MAFWVVDGSRALAVGPAGRGPFYVGGKRRVSHSEGSDINDSFTYSKRLRFGDNTSNIDGGYRGQVNGTLHGYEEEYIHRQGYPDCGHEHLHHAHASNPGFGDARRYDHRTPPDSVAIENVSFLVIRERSPSPAPSPSPHLAASSAMERTASGLSISSDTSQCSIASLGSEAEDSSMMSDLQAAWLVRDHVAARRYSDSQHGRILKALINPKSRAADFRLDNLALRSIFSAANELFFANRLTGRVAWDWSHPESEQYEAHIVGTTALRRSRLGGYETLIVLSSPILKDTKYNRRLLISTFLHEMIHSYLFITCGLKARECGGHTEGFREIAATIDTWVGQECLRLSDMEANLERFRDDRDQVDERLRLMPDRWPRRMRQGPAVRERDDYYPNEPPRARMPNSHNEWQWYEREGFHARNAHAGGSPYVSC